MFNKNYVNLVGDKRFELSNHLGNVLVVVSDKKIADNSKAVTQFNPDVLSFSDYYPFGMLVPNRHGSSDSYRYGFNGKENDNEIMGEGNFQDYGERSYNPRIGRFFSVDPLSKVFPMLSSYQYAANSPIANIDLDGREAENFIFGLKKKMMGVTALKMNNLNSVVGEIQKQYYKVHIVNPEKSVDQLYNQIAKDINSIYGTDKGSFSFEKQQTSGQIKKGDYINIDQGVKGLDFAVKVADVSVFKNNKPSIDGPHKGFSLTFRTLEGHVETGVITFTALEHINLQTGLKTFDFSISSTSQIDHGTATVLLNDFAREQQQGVWHQVLKNISKFVEGDVTNAFQRKDKYSPDEFEVVKNNEKTLGSPRDGAKPETECSEINCD
jgi:RHS repeat-associated protein